jgi:hypothetical protein
MKVYDLHRYDEHNDSHELWGGFDGLSEALTERDRLNHDGLHDDFVVIKRILGQLDYGRFKPYMEWKDVNGSEGMNQLQIAIELQGMLAHLRHYEKINEAATSDKAAAGAAYAYGHSCRRIDKLLVKVLAEGVEVDE